MYDGFLIALGHPPIYPSIHYITIGSLFSPWGLCPSLIAYTYLVVAHPEVVSALLRSISPFSCSLVKAMHDGLNRYPTNSLLACPCLISLGKHVTLGLVSHYSSIFLMVRQVIVYWDYSNSLYWCHLG